MHVCGLIAHSTETVATMAVMIAGMAATSENRATNRLCSRAPARAARRGSKARQFHRDEDDEDDDDQAVAHHQRQDDGRGWYDRRFAYLHAVESPGGPAALLPDRDGALGEMAAVGGDPCRHRAVAFAHHAVDRNRRRAHRRADADDEIGEHAPAQLVPRIADLPAAPATRRVFGVDRRRRRCVTVPSNITAGKRVDPDAAPAARRGTPGCQSAETFASIHIVS